MKYILTILLSLFLIEGFSQPLPQGNPLTSSTQWVKYGYVKSDSGSIQAVRDTNWKARYVGTEVIWFNNGVDTVTWMWDGIKWKKAASGSSGVTLPQLNDTLTNYVRIQTQNPTATLTGGVSQERLPSGAALSYTLNWSGGRQAAGVNIAATKPLSTIVVASVNQTFTQPNVGSSASGTQSVSVPRNTTTSYNNVVTTTDNKTATATTTFSFYDKRYLGWSTTTTPSDAEILAAVYSDNSGGTASLTRTLSQLGSARHLFYANTATISSVNINGFNSTSSFVLNQSRTLTNASGGVTTYYVSTSNNSFGNLSQTAVILQ